MAENKGMHNDNIKQVSELIKDGKLEALIDSSNKFVGEIKGLKGLLEEKLKAFDLAKKQSEEQAKEKVEEPNVQPSPAQPVEQEKQSVSEEKVEKKAKTKKAKEQPEATVVQKDATADKQAEKPLETTEKVDEIKPNKEEKQQEKGQEQSTKTVEESTPVEQKETQEKAVEKPNEFIPPARPSFILRRDVPIQRYDRRDRTDKTDRNSQERRQPRGEFRPTDRPNRNADNKFQNSNKEGFTPRQPKPDFNKGGMNKKPQNTFVAPPIIQKDDKRNFSKKKQSGERSFEDKHVINKRALIKGQVDIDDFDENKSGYRKVRPAKKTKENKEVNVIKIEKAVINTEIIPLKVLSEKIGITAAEITKRLFKEGIMKTINDSIDFDTAAFIADDIGVELELKLDKTAEDVLSEGFDDVQDAPEKLKKRPPVVTVMGHVDHGKTSLLDRIRKTNVTAGEAGGITQHIGAYQVTVGGETITFLDTPGHAAFTAMRARGAQATDIAILVVAADDGIMPQTVEAINHAKAADVPIIVAINKIDKPEANIDRIKTQLTEHGLLPEEWGGDAILCPISAKTGEGFDNLLENINLVAEIKELKANPDRKAKGVVIEAKLDQSKGPIATILVQNGTLKISDSVIVGTVTGKIRAMVDDKGRRVTSAGPSTPVSIMGLDEVPNSGDILYAVEHEKLAKLVAQERQNKEKENMLKASAKVTLDDVFNRIAEGEMKVLPLIVKADVQGSVEAVKQSLEKLSNAEVKVNVIHAAAGAIKESDIMLAESSKAIIIGFNVRPDSNAKQIAERSGIDIKLYRVIYEAIEDVERALKGMLAPKFKEVYMGKAEVREVFKISGVGQVAGCYVTEGKIIRSGKLRIYRDDVMICEGNVMQLKRFKDDVKEVAQGFECGISIEKFNDIKVGDFIESYQVEENKE
ncbi:MAG: translation initiation factor IF-2 [Clostridiales bacterium]|nr:translation initiation factor IF-2 [Clostridiales bacterium]